MPGIVAIAPEMAEMTGYNLVEQKVDGARHFFDGRELTSERGIARNERFPHIVEDLSRLGIVAQGEVAIPGGNVFSVSQAKNWGKAKFYPFDVRSIRGIDITDLSLLERRFLMEQYLAKRNHPNIFLPLRFRDFKDGWETAKRDGLEGVVLKCKNGTQWKVKVMKEMKVPILDHLVGKSKGAFLIEHKGVQSKVSARSMTYVNAYHTLLAHKEVPYAEIEYLFLTENGIPYQPKLRRVGTLVTLS